MPRQESYGYQEFLEDYFEFFMSDLMEFTNCYCMVYEDEFSSPEVEPCVQYGVENGYLWVVPIEGTPIVYLELVDAKVRLDLVHLYISKLESSDISVDEQVKDLSDLYTEYLLRFTRDLQSLSVSEEGVMNPFGIANHTDEVSTELDGKLVPIYNVSLRQFMNILESVGMRPLGIWSGLPELREYLSPKGIWDEGVQDVRVDELVTALFTKGIQLKRINVHG